MPEKTTSKQLEEYVPKSSKIIAEGIASAFQIILWLLFAFGFIVLFLNELHKFLN